MHTVFFRHAEDWQKEEIKDRDYSRATKNYSNDQINLITALLFTQKDSGLKMEGEKFFQQKESNLRKILLASKNNFVNNKVTNTKYTVLNFIPKNLILQFGTFMNCYFLMIACLQLVNEIAPVNPITIWLPLIFIFTVSALKGNSIFYAVSFTLNSSLYITWSNFYRSFIEVLFGIYVPIQQIVIITIFFFNSHYYS